MELSEIPYIKRAVEIRCFLEGTFSDFPDGYCGLSAFLLERLVNIRCVAGIFVVQEHDLHGHAWNYDSKRSIYLDISHNQFDKTLPKIKVFSILNSVLIEKPDMTAKLYRHKKALSAEIERLSFAFTHEFQSALS